MGPEPEKGEVVTADNDADADRGTSLYRECVEREDWCGKAGGPCVLIFHGACGGCQYFVKNG